MYNFHEDLGDLPDHQRVPFVRRLMLGADMYLEWHCRTRNILEIETNIGQK